MPRHVVESDTAGGDLGGTYPSPTVASNVYKSGGTDVAVADGGTGASTAGGAKTNLGLVSAGTYTVTNVTTDRTYDANATTVDELADVLGSLLADLKGIGVIG